MAAVRIALEQLGLEKYRYAETFEDEGFDDLCWLQRQSDEILQQIAQDDIKMKRGHVLRFPRGGMPIRPCARARRVVRPPCFSAVAPRLK